MAVKVKAKNKDNLNLYEEKEIKVKKSKKVEEEKKEESVEKKSLWARFMNFCHGVKNETGKVRWTSKENMVKYSIATIIFVIFCSLFFYGIDAVFAAVQALFK